MSFVYNNKNYKILGMKNEEYNSFRELEFLETIKTIVPSGSVCIDIGANVGSHTVFLASEIGARKVFSFEPIPMVFDVLKHNITVNNITDKVIAYNIAISSKNKNLKCISKLPDYHGSYWLWYSEEDYKHPYDRGYKVHKGCDGSAYTNEIKSDKLDSVMKNENFDEIDFIKIDVEGMEFEVLKGARELIETHKPVLQIEVAIDNNENISKFLSEFNYKRIRGVFKNENQLWCQK